MVNSIFQISNFPHTRSIYCLWSSDLILTSVPFLRSAISILPRFDSSYHCVILFFLIHRRRDIHFDATVQLVRTVSATLWYAISGMIPVLLQSFPHLLQTLPTLFFKAPILYHTFFKTRRSPILQVVKSCVRSRWTFEGLNISLLAPLTLASQHYLM